MSRLLSVSTFGWFDAADLADVGTFGWFGGVGLSLVEDRPQRQAIEDAEVSVIAIADVRATINVYCTRPKDTDFAIASRTQSSVNLFVAPENKRQSLTRLQAKQVAELLDWGAL